MKNLFSEENQSFYRFKKLETKTKKASSYFGEKEEREELAELDSIDACVFKTKCFLKRFAKDHDLKIEEYRRRTFLVFGSVRIARVKCVSSVEIKENEFGGFILKTDGSNDDRYRFESLVGNYPISGKSMENGDYFVELRENFKVGNEQVSRAENFFNLIVETFQEKIEYSY